MRAKEDSAHDSFAGSLLLAHPVLRDPNFRRSVVLMSTHNAKGSMGVVLNRPTGQRLGDLRSDFSLGPLADTPIFTGGPVHTDHLILVAWQVRSDGFRLHFGVVPERACELLGEEGARVRAFLGYAGWDGGQLESELERSAWVVAEAPPDLFERPANETLWRNVLAEEGDHWRLVADEPDDPGQN